MSTFALVMGTSSKKDQKTFDWEIRGNEIR